jgi:hypothetical protein
VDYIASLERRDAPGYAELLQVQWSEERARPRTAAPSCSPTAPPAHFPVVGQITEPGRAFHPAANGVDGARGLQPARDRLPASPGTTCAPTSRGENAPDLPVPPEEDLGDPTLLAPAAAAEAEGGDFWGEAAAPEASAEDFWGEAEAPAAADDVGGDDFWGEAGDASPAAPTSGAEFSDAVAIQLPAQLPTGIRKPYFLFGDAQNPVDLWFVDLATKIARRYAAAGSTSVTAVEGEDVTAIASFDRGAWSVILKRSLKTSSGIAFAEAQYVPIAFSLWDGTARERGNKRGLTQWKYLYTMPRTTPSPAWPMLRTALAVLAVEIGLVWWVRRRTKRQHGEAESHV